MNKNIYIKSATVRRLNHALSECKFEVRVKILNPASKTMGTSEEFLISNTDEGNFFLKHIDNKIKIGKILKATTNLSDVEIETVSTYWKSIYDVDTSKVVIMDDVAEAYNISGCGGSCMANQDYDFFDIYKDIGTKIVVVLNEHGDLGARALIHDLCNYEASMRVKAIDRVFFEKEIYKITIDRWAKENGYKTMSDFSGKILLSSPISMNYDAVPYADSLNYAVVMNGTYRLTNNSSHGSFRYYDTLNETNGSSSDRQLSNRVGEDDVYCEDIGEYRHLDDCFYNITSECYYSSDYGLVYIDSDGYYEEDDDDIAYDMETEQYDFKSNLKETYDDEFTSSDDYVIIDVGTQEGYYAHYENTYTLYDGNVVHEGDGVYYSEDTDEYFLEEDLGVHYFEHDDGLYYSHEEEDEEEEEEEEEENEEA